MPACPYEPVYCSSMGTTEEEVITFARERLLDRLETAESRIWMASPFVSSPIAAAIGDAVAQSTAGQRRLLTDLHARAVQCGVLDPKALKKLQECGFEIRSIGHLHAKASFVDSTWALLGSGNLTGAGLGDEEGSGNYEMGVLLDSAQRKRASEIFVEWWREAEEVTPQKIAYFSTLPRFPQKSKARVGPTLTPPDEAPLEQVLAEDRATAEARRYWINTNYHDPNDERWWRRGWVSDWARKPYKRNDLLVVYLGKENGGPALCPAVLRVTTPPRCEPDFVRRERDLEAEERWPWVTRTACVEEVSPFDGASLEVADLTYHAVQRGREITRSQFEALVGAMLGG